eukprot:CAMPEP_0194068308 /NCGR_PEP_ID=MMETSP0009_2-20130614/87025_1 /TAXON_ID=210454 /ORGANISM="Grammatophora oceanica, Strain CCMP 410" /LENGTH=231 /DNA_ID=CAMNT_0038721397 /DNA_START=260 /DNA_END=956 /DNA_ORIENTATION=+
MSRSASGEVHQADRYVCWAKTEEVLSNDFNYNARMCPRDLTLETLQEMATDDFDRFKGLDFSGIKSNVLDALAKIGSFLPPGEGQCGVIRHTNSMRPSRELFDFERTMICCFCLLQNKKNVDIRICGSPSGRSLRVLGQDGGGPLERLQLQRPYVPACLPAGAQLWSRHDVEGRKDQVVVGSRTHRDPPHRRGSKLPTCRRWRGHDVILDDFFVTIDGLGPVSSSDDSSLR